MVSIDEWPVDSYYPLGHYVRTLGQIGDKDTETECILFEHDVSIEVDRMVMVMLMLMVTILMTYDGDENHNDADDDGAEDFADDSLGALLCWPAFPQIITPSPLRNARYIYHMIITIIVENFFNYGFFLKIIIEVKYFLLFISLIMPQDRLDLTKELIFSIDPPGCTDIDDALHVKQLPNGNYEAGVRLAFPISAIAHFDFSLCITIYL